MPQGQGRRGGPRGARVSRFFNQQEVRSGWRNRTQETEDDLRHRTDLEQVAPRIKRAPHHEALEVAVFMPRPCDVPVLRRGDLGLVLPQQLGPGVHPPCRLDGDIRGLGQREPEVVHFSRDAEDGSRGLAERDLLCRELRIAGIRHRAEVNGVRSGGALDFGFDEDVVGSAFIAADDGELAHVARRMAVGLPPEAVYVPERPLRIQFAGGEYPVPPGRRQRDFEEVPLVAGVDLTPQGPADRQRRCLTDIAPVVRR